MPGSYSRVEYRIVEFEPNRYYIKERGLFGLWFKVTENSYAGEHVIVYSTLEDAREALRNHAEMRLAQKAEQQEKAKFKKREYWFQENGKPLDY
jgi:hypothetical protein